MTPQEVIDIAKKSFDVAVSKDDEDLKKQALDFYESVIECAKKAMIVDKARDMLDDVDTDAFLRSLMK